VWENNEEINVPSRKSTQKHITCTLTGPNKTNWGNQQKSYRNKSTTNPHWIFCTILIHHDNITDHHNSLLISMLTCNMNKYSCSEAADENKWKWTHRSKWESTDGKKLSTCTSWALTISPPLRGGYMYIVINKLENSLNQIRWTTEAMTFAMTIKKLRVSRIISSS
jgi:hypothetical protein